MVTELNNMTFKTHNKIGLNFKFKVSAMCRIISPIVFRNYFSITMIFDFKLFGYSDYFPELPIFGIVHG